MFDRFEVTPCGWQDANIQLLTNCLLFVQEDQDDADFRKLKQLGEFSLGLSEERIEKMSANAILQNLPTLGLLPLTRDQAEAVLDKLEEAMP